MLFSRARSRDPKFLRVLWKDLRAKISKIIRTRSLEENISDVKKQVNLRSITKVVLNPSQFLKGQFLKDVKNLPYKTLFFGLIIRYMNSSGGRCRTALI